MKIIVQRSPSSNKCTHGVLSIGDKFQCVTLEDEIREIEGWPVEDWKAAGHSAIPAGTYELRMTFSNRFQKTMPQLMNVPGFEGIRIHTGNFASDTEGCVLLGTRAVGASIVESRGAYEAFLAILDTSDHTIEIRNPQ